MSGVEKFALAAVASATTTMVSLAQITISNVGTLFGIGWAIIGAVLGIGISQGMTRQRLAALEKRIDELASKEAIKSLDDKVTTLVGMLNHRIADRRHHE
jgi:hypothetical protein